MRPGSDAILFRAHRCTPGTLHSLRRIAAEAGPAFDLWLVGFSETPEALNAFAHPRTIVYDTASFGDLAYPAKRAGFRAERTTGHNDLPVLRFFRDRPHYDHYWVVEYDVRFTGHWGALLADLSRSKADVLGTSVQSYAENPLWANWPTVGTAGEDIEKASWVKSFMPFGRVSRAALSAIDAAYRRGWTGHSEATWPMIALRHGLTVEDLGGDGAFVPPERRGRYYWNSPLDPHLRPGSFVFRPTVAENQDDQAWTGQEAGALAWAAEQLRRPDTLVHPVKD